MKEKLFTPMYLPKHIHIFHDIFWVTREALEDSSLLNDIGGFAEKNKNSEELKNTFCQLPLRPKQLFIDRQYSISTNKQTNKLHLIAVFIQTILEEDPC